MTSPAQIAANRRNAQLSTGPRTPSGKQISSQNALKHGILSRQVVTPSEDPDEFATHLAALVDDIQPVGAVEELLVQQIALYYWRLGRIIRCDADLFGRHQEESAVPPQHVECGIYSYIERAAPVPSSDYLDPLLRYERTITNQLNRSLVQLERLQRQRLSRSDTHSDETNPITPVPAQSSDETNPIPPLETAPDTNEGLPMPALPSRGTKMRKIDMIADAMAAAGEFDPPRPA
ncbi:MAG TPA: hypothetical protein VFA78_03090 [Chloroflexota bacterium]|nr:hypothetical protein [Chloroflexota bacterium]